MALSTQPYKGARDFYPADKRLQKYMFVKLRTVAERFGYEEYDAPILEPLEIYLAKTGEEIVNEQTYAFEDRGGRKVVIRPEMTPTVSRMVAAKRQELAYPLRWYSIPNLWRYERPQRGRLREHWQLNVDIFGVATIAAEQEIISVVDATFKEYGATEDMYEIHLNHRQLTNYLLHVYLGFDDRTAYAAGKLLDRMHKLKHDEFVAQADALLNDEQKQAGVLDKLTAVLSAKQLSDLPDAAKQQASYGELQGLLASLQAAGVTNIRYDVSLMRGLDYYTGVVFEVFDTHPDNNRSMLGGGRYDGLVGLFGVEPVPTVGFGWGDVTLANFLELHNLLPPLPPETDVYAVLVGEVADAAQPVLTALRNQGLNVAVDYSGRKIGDQFKTAEKKGIRHVVIIGADELAAQAFKLKDLDSGDERQLPLDAIADAVKQ